MATVEKFKFWCNKILPLVYDDSLSYYEFLGKVYEKLNETIDAVNANTDAITEFDQRINDFIDAETAAREGWEDQQAQKWAAFQAMFISEYDPDNAYVKGDLCSVQYKMFVANASTTGTFDPAKWDEIVLSDYLADYVSTAAASMQSQYDGFLSDYQRSFGITDAYGSSTTDALSSLGAAKMYNSGIDGNLIDYTKLTPGKQISSAGVISDAADNAITDYIDLTGITKIHGRRIRVCCFFAADDSVVSGGGTAMSTGGSYDVPEGATKCRLTLRYSTIRKSILTRNHAEYLYGAPTEFPYELNHNYPTVKNLANYPDITALSQLSSGIYVYNAATSQTLTDLPTPLTNRAGFALVTAIPVSSHKIILASSLWYTSSVVPPVVYIKYSGHEWISLDGQVLPLANVGVTDMDAITSEVKFSLTSANDYNTVSNLPADINKNVNSQVIVTRTSQGTLVTYILNGVNSGSLVVYYRSGSSNWSKFGAGIQNPFVNKTIAWLGDSIVAGSGTPLSFASLTCSALGASFSNFGRWSATLSNNERDVPILAEVVETIPATADIIAVSAGTNDWYHADTPVGTVADTTPATFYGALNYICKYICDNFTGKPVFFTTPIKRVQGDLSTIDSVNTNGKTLKEYCDIIKEVCARYSIPVLDMWSESGLNPQLTSNAVLFADDNIHPNATGKAVMAARMTGWLKQLM